MLPPQPKPPPPWSPPPCYGPGYDIGNPPGTNTLPISVTLVYFALSFVLLSVLLICMVTAYWYRRVLPAWLVPQLQVSPQRCPQPEEAQPIDRQWSPAIMYSSGDLQALRHMGVDGAATAPTTPAAVALAALQHELAAIEAEMAATRAMPAFRD